MAESFFKSDGGAAAGHVRPKQSESRATRRGRAETDPNPDQGTLPGLETLKIPPLLKPVETIPAALSQSPKTPLSSWDEYVTRANCASVFDAVAPHLRVNPEQFEFLEDHLKRNQGWKDGKGFSLGVTSTVLYGPTSSGKTITALAAAAPVLAHGGTVIYVVPSEQALRQVVHEAEGVLKLKPGGILSVSGKTSPELRKLIYDDLRDGPHLLVGMAITLTKDIARLKLSAPVFMVLDEGHHVSDGRKADERRHKYPEVSNSGESAHSRPYLKLVQFARANLVGILSLTGTPSKHNSENQLQALLDASGAEVVIPMGRRRTNVAIEMREIDLEIAGGKVERCRSEFASWALTAQAELVYQLECASTGRLPIQLVSQYQGLINRLQRLNTKRELVSASDVADFEPIMQTFRRFDKEAFGRSSTSFGELKSLRHYYADITASGLLCFLDRAVSSYIDYQAAGGADSKVPRQYQKRIFGSERFRDLLRDTASGTAYETILRAMRGPLNKPRNWIAVHEEMFPNVSVDPAARIEQLQQRCKAQALDDYAKSSHFDHPKEQKLYAELDRHLTSGSNGGVLIFCDRHSQAKFLAARINDRYGSRGLVAEAAIGETGTKQEAVFDRFRTGVTKVLVGTKFDESVHLPRAMLGIAYVPPFSPTMLTQQIGRLGRSFGEEERRLAGISETGARYVALVALNTPDEKRWLASKKPVQEITKEVISKRVDPAQGKLAL